LKSFLQFLSSNSLECNTVICAFQFTKLQHTFKNFQQTFFPSSKNKSSTKRQFLFDFDKKKEKLAKPQDNKTHFFIALFSLLIFYLHWQNFTPLPLPLLLLLLLPPPLLIVLQHLVWDLWSWICHPTSC